MEIIIWNYCSKGQPEIGGEYLVVWKITEESSVSTSMDWDLIDETWSNPRAKNQLVPTNDILMWAEFPNLSKS